MSTYKWPPEGGGSGTVTSIAVETENGFAGTVANSTTAADITLKTTVTGLLQGDGTAISAATVGNLTDAGTDGITIGSGSGAVLGSGTSISQHVADASHNGYLSSTDWSTFNGKQAAGSYITALTGDVTASGPGSVASTVAKIAGVAVGTPTGTGNVVFSASPTLTGTVHIGSAGISGPAVGSLSLGTAGTGQGFVEALNSTNQIYLGVNDNANSFFGSLGANQPVIYTNASLILATAGAHAALVLDTSQNATFGTSATDNQTITLNGGANTRIEQNPTSGNSFWDNLLVGSSSVFRTSASSGVDTNALILAANGAATFSGLVTANSGIAIAGGSFAAGSIYKSATLGLAVVAITGSSTDFQLLDTAGSQAIMSVPTGTDNVRFVTLAGTGSRAVLADANGQLSAPVSDARLKKNVQDLAEILNPLNTIDKLRPVAFHWDTQNERVSGFGDGQEFGFIAQEAEPVVPQVVRGNRDGYLSMDYDKLVPVLVAALQDLKSQFDAYVKAHP